MKTRSFKTPDKLFLIVLSLFIVISCSKKEPLYVDYLNPEINYSGRLDSISQQAAALNWSGTSVKINFEGSSVQALLQDEHGDNYYNIIIDSDNIF